MADLKKRKSGKKGTTDVRRTQMRILRYYLGHWQLFVLGLVCSIFILLIQVWFVQLIDDTLKAATFDRSKLALEAGLIVLVHFLKWFCSYGQSYAVSAATNRIAVQLRNELYSRLQNLSLGYFEHTKVGHLMSRMTNDIGLVQNSGSQVISAVSAPFMILGLAYKIFTMNWKLSLISIVLLPVMAYAIVTISRQLKHLTSSVQSRLADVAAIVQETLSAIRIVKSFAAEDYETSRFSEENNRAYRVAMRAVRSSAAITPTVELIGVIGIAFVLWYGGTMIPAHPTENSFGVSTLAAFLAALNMMANSARDVGRIQVVYQQTMAGAERIFEILDENPEIQDAPDAIEVQSVEGRVQFSNVSFAYNPETMVLRHISFAAEPGQVVALVGPSGAGKSTIANLIPRFYEVTDGGVLVDGVDIRRITLNSLRQQIGIVPQETILFSSSIRENIAYGRMDATDAEIEAAARAANAHDFITGLPDGYDTLVGERGARLAGGQRQRVSIARALLKNPRILILDEATSSLDVASEAVVQDALDRLMKDRTTIVIAHRLSTIVNADKILVMKDGQIVESGTHGELLALGGLYAELYAVQSRRKQDVDSEVEVSA